MMLATIDRPKKRDLVATRIQALIARKKLKPGDRLPTETALAAQFGVSRLSLREATKALEFLGIVEARPGRGLTVGKMNLERVTGCLGFHPALHDADAEELIQTRVVVETGALPYVARNMAHDPSIADTLQHINHKLQKARELQDWVDLDIEFHRRLIASSGLLPLAAFNDLLAVFFQRFRESVKKARWKPGIASHQRLIDHLRQGRVSAAQDEMRRHVESHRARIALPGEGGRSDRPAGGSSAPK